MTAPRSLSPDTQATLLLCGHFTGSDGAGHRPLTTAEYNKLAKEMLTRNLRPADLLAGAPSGQGFDTVPPERLDALLRRGTAMALSFDRWSQSGIGVLGRGDPAYPHRLRRVLKAAAPPILYVAGNLDLVGGDAVCAVGSRDATDSGLQFARRLGACCASEGLAVVSGDARGVDREAMLGALDAGGKAIGVLAEALYTAVTSKRNRQALSAGTLCLISPYSPESRFTVAHAMERNKYLYALSIAAVIVDSDVKGGTWAGAVENQKRRWVPAFVRMGVEIGEGNRKLAELGLHTLTADALEAGRIRALLTCDRMDDGAGGNGAGEKDGTPPALPLFDATPVRPKGDAAPEQAGASSGPGDVLFEVFVSQLVHYTKGQPRSEEQIADDFAIERQQVRRWLERARDQQRLFQAGDPPRYSVERP